MQPLHNFFFFLFFLFWQFKPLKRRGTDTQSWITARGGAMSFWDCPFFPVPHLFDSSFHSTVDGDQPTCPRGAVRCFSHPHLPGHTPLIIKLVTSERAVAATMSSHSRPGKSSLWPFSAFHLRLPLSEQDKHYGISSAPVSITSVCK